MDRKNERCSRSKRYFLRSRLRRSVILQDGQIHSYTMVLRPFPPIKRSRKVRKPMNKVNGSVNNSSPVANDVKNALDSEENIKCAICLDTQNLEEFQPVICGHNFHRVCLETWLQIKKLCPMCRTSLDAFSTLCPMCRRPLDSLPT